MQRLNWIMIGLLLFTSPLISKTPKQAPTPVLREFVVSEGGTPPANHWTTTWGEKAPPEQGKGYKPSTPEVRKALYAYAKAQHGGRLAMQAKFQTLPAAFDCRDKGWVLPVGDQGNCGSCYLYSTIYGTLSQCFVKAGYGKPDLSFVMSVQYGMDCHNFGGCNGGNGTEVIAWVIQNGWPAEKWVDTEGKVHNDYPPYEARQRACRKVAGAKYWKPAAWGFATGDQSDRPATVNEIKTMLVNYGAGNVALDAGGQFSNGTGTIIRLGTNIDHEIEVVAYDDNHDNGDGTKGAVLLKNQWTTSWGNKGYRWLAYHQVPRLVDVFWISAAPLPPPPPPPDPPIPPGPGPIKVLGSGKLADGTPFEMVTPGTKARLDAVEEASRRLIEALKLGPDTKPETFPKPLPKGEPQSMSPEIERGFRIILDRFDLYDLKFQEYDRILGVSPKKSTGITEEEANRQLQMIVDAHNQKIISERK